MFFISIVDACQETGNFQQAQSSQVDYVSQPGHSYQQPTATYTTSKSPASEYYTPSQSAFSSYASHFSPASKGNVRVCVSEIFECRESSHQGSIVIGYSGRSPTQQGPPTSSYQPTSSQANYPGQQLGTPGRPGYTQQQQGRYY